MLNVDGVMYSRIDRLTFDGAKTAGIAVDQSWNGSTGNFDTGNQYADDTFQDTAIGVRGGALGYGFAETSVLRAHFIRTPRPAYSSGTSTRSICGMVFTV